MRGIPFLNCALFDCLDNRKKRPEEGGGIYYYDGFSRAKEKRAHVPNGLFFDAERGLVTLFNSFEFTIDENNADDADVALDPELLGKVFENLLGAYNPETKDTARNATGSFYTPREIVDYMVEESLKNYLKTKVPKAKDAWLNDLFDRQQAAEGVKLPFDDDMAGQLREALYSCKILDPACGSGAFPMGILNCMVRILERLDPAETDICDRIHARYVEEKNAVNPNESVKEREKYLADVEYYLKQGNLNPEYYRKLFIIEKCIYGVDIQSIAVQITKLRFFVSLLCDQLRSNYKEGSDNSGILPLPNLETKFACANTLVALPDLNDKLGLSWGDLEKKRRELADNRHEIFRARGVEAKKRLEANDARIRQEIEGEVTRILTQPDEREIGVQEQIIAELQAEREQYAQPKMIKQKVTRQKPLKQDDLFADPTPEPVGKQEFEEIVEIMVDANEAKRNSIDSRIRQAELLIRQQRDKANKSNVLEAVKYAQLVASWDPYDQHQVSEFFDSKWMFNIENGFDVVIGNPPYVLIDKAEYAKKYSAFFRCQSGKIDLYRLFMEKAFASLAATLGAVVSYITPNTFLAIPSCKMLRRYLLQEHTFERIVNYDEDVFDGVSVNSVVFVASTGTSGKEHSIYVSPDGDLKNFYPIDQLECLENDECAIRIFQSKEVSSVLKKMASCGRTVGNSQIDLCLGEQPYHNTIHTKKQMESRFLHSDHKVNSAYLQELGGRDIFKYCVTRTRPIYLDYSAELYTKPPMKYFRGERIIVREIPGETLVCAYATEEFLVNKSCYVLKNSEKEISYLTLLSILNSRLVGFWIANSGEKTKQNLFPRISMASLKAIPLPRISSLNNKLMSELASNVVNAKANDVHADTSALEAKIDQLVYKLYGLTEEEIAVVEGKNEKNPPQPKSERPRRATKPTAVIAEPKDDEELE